MSGELATVRGKLPLELGNAVSEAIYKAGKSGMQADEACSVALGVVVDYAVAFCGADYGRSLADFVEHLVTKAEARAAEAAIAP